MRPRGFSPVCRPGLEILAQTWTLPVIPGETLGDIVGEIPRLQLK
jgi:hypothetical protein